MLSLVIPIYKSEEGLPSLFEALEKIKRDCFILLKKDLEVVFVVDGSPDMSYDVIKSSISKFNFKAQLISLSRNFGSFAAVRTGLELAHGEHFAVMAADLQEPPELIVEFFKALLSGSTDIVVGQRISRNDPFLSNLSSLLFWRLYRKCVIKDIPQGGIDIFGCNKIFRDHLVSLNESHSSLVGLIYWLGFRRLEIPYTRRPRLHGKSAWSFRGKMKYMFDSLFAFTDLPIKILIVFGLIGVFTSIFFSVAVLFLKFFDLIPVPGYAATIITIVFFGGLNSLGIGIVGNYTWRAYENSKQRPLSVIRTSEQNY